ncbi:hypothetical protein CEXT_121291 [Caerostris extrusa]|uniref:Uncharacterized protein n=1 Tax=Caerostris extrusa TaxID=172846 RepID=A0AAV4TVB4_CAEEX|nr:hypothetical protein CEXT_121291 [Caerostris extrusa]
MRYISFIPKFGLRVDVDRKSHFSVYIPFSKEVSSNVRSAQAAHVRGIWLPSPLSLADIKDSSGDGEVTGRSILARQWDIKRYHAVPVCIVVCAKETAGNINENKSPGSVMRLQVPKRNICAVYISIESPIIFSEIEFNVYCCTLP